MNQMVHLHLSTGETFSGQLIGAPLKAAGELVFTTALVGYSESLTDPSYFGQILVFSYPLIGNYGVPPVPDQDWSQLTNGFESDRVHATAVIVADDSHQAFHWTSHQSLDSWLREQKVPGIVGLDTRHLIHLIRNNPGLSAKLEPVEPQGLRYPDHLERTDDQGFFNPGSHNVVSEVSVTEPVLLGKGNVRIAIPDCGIKWNILRQMIRQDCEIELLPWDTNPESVDCSGWLLSNGPGNPLQTGNLIPNIQKLLEQHRPILGICLGHQLLSIAAGFNSKKMPYGHRSHNQPVYLTGTRKGYMTSQNHGYVIDDSHIPEDWEIWFRNVNDETVEGIRHRTKPFRGVQFHPESAGGPRDTSWIIGQFISEVKRYAGKLQLSAN